MTPYSSFPIGYTVQLVRNRVVEEDRKIYQDILGQCDCDCSSDCACSTDPCSIHAESDLEFANHEDILRKIARSKNYRMIVLFGPYGYGKTRLLHEAIVQMGTTWHCVLVDLWDSSNNSPKTKTNILQEICQKLEIPLDGVDADNPELGFWLGKQIQTPLPYALMFDMVERAELQTISWLRKLVMDLCKPDRQDKFVFSTQNLGEEDWKRYQKCALQAIGADTLKDVLRGVLPEINPPLIDEVSERIIWLSCGHPGTLVSLVRYWRVTEFLYTFDPADDRFTERLKKNLDPFVREVAEDLGNDNFQLLRRICVYYMIDQNVLKALESEGLLIGYQQAWSRLLRWQVFVERDGIFTDGVIRPLLARWLEFIEPDTYRQYHQFGLDIWNKSFDSVVQLARASGVQRSPAVQVMRAIIYHALCRAACGYQKLRTQEKEDRRKEYLTCIVNTLIKCSADCDQAMSFYRSAADFGAEEILALEVKLKLQWLDVDGRDVENAFLRISKQRSGHDAPKGDDQMNGIDAIFEAVADAITMLKHNAQNVLRERWEKRNKGKATTPPIFEDQPMSDGKPISEEQVIEQTIQDVRERVKQGLPTHFSNPDGESIEISEEHIGSLKDQIANAQRSIDMYQVEIANPQSASEKVVLVGKQQEHKKIKEKAEQELADIIAYLLDPNS